MMLGEQDVASWNNEMNYKNDVLLFETDGSQMKAELCGSVDGDKQLCSGKASKIGASRESGRKVSGKVSKSKAPSGSSGRSKSDVPLRSKISTSGSMMIRSKSEKEEEKRKRMEELLIQRQKRIAERSAAKGSVTPETSKSSSKDSKKKNSVSTKSKLRTPTDHDNKKSHKPILRSSTIDRLAASRTINYPLPTGPKVGQNKEPTPRENCVTPTSSLKKAKGTDQKQNKDKANPSDKKKGTHNPTISSEKSEKTRVKNGILEDSESVNVLLTVSSSEKREANTLSIRDDSVDKKSVRVIPDKVLLLSVEDNVNDQVGLAPPITVNPTVGINDFTSTVPNVGKKKRLTFSPEISVVNISTPPPSDETNQELIHSRKKWNNGESSPKIPKGFRRLLLFGRRT